MVDELLVSALADQIPKDPQVFLLVIHTRQGSLGFLSLLARDKFERCCRYLLSGPKEENLG